MSSTSFSTDLELNGLSCIIVLGTGACALLCGALAIATLPVLFPLGPEFLREAVFHGFLRGSIPLSALPALLLLYTDGNRGEGCNNDAVCNVQLLQLTADLRD